MPARAPASMDMLQSVSRPSMESPQSPTGIFDHMARAPAAPMRRDDGEDDVLRGDAGAELAVDMTRMVFGSRCHIVCVASTCLTSVAPMPKASAPNAPWVEVWLSPQTMSCRAG